VVGVQMGEKDLLNSVAAGPKRGNAVAVCSRHAANDAGTEVD